MQIGIVDYGAGNILSVYNSIYNLGHDPIIIKDSKKIKDFDRIIIPGVGSAYKALKNLKKGQYIEEIKKFYISILLLSPRIGFLWQIFYVSQVIAKDFQRW